MILFSREVILAVHRELKIKIILLVTELKLMIKVLFQIDKKFKLLIKILKKILLLIRLFKKIKIFKIMINSLKGIVRFTQVK